MSSQESKSRLRSLEVVVAEEEARETVTRVTKRRRSSNPFRAEEAAVDVDVVRVEEAVEVVVATLEKVDLGLQIWPEEVMLRLREPKLEATERGSMARLVRMLTPWTDKTELAVAIEVIVREATNAEAGVELDLPRKTLIQTLIIPELEDKTKKERKFAGLPSSLRKKRKLVTLLTTITKRSKPNLRVS